MNRQEVFEYIKKQYGIDPDYPWADANAVLRHPKNNKWFAVILEVGRDKLGLDEEGMVDVVNVKSEPLLIASLRMQQGYHPAYHMNKENWISIRLDGSAPEDEIKKLLRLSYELTMPKEKKAICKKEQQRKNGTKGA